MRTALLAALSLAAAPLGAQATDTARTALERGAYSLSFTSPILGDGGGSGSIGFWRMVSARTNLGITVGARGQRQENSEVRGDTTREIRSEQSQLSFMVGPAVRHYVTAAKRTAAFVYAGARAGVSRARQSGEAGYRAESRGVDVDLWAGVGLEWFAVRTFSVSGYTGLMAGAGSVESRSPDREAEVRNSSVGTFTSGLSVNLYLPRRRSPDGGP